MGRDLLLPSCDEKTTNPLEIYNFEKSFGESFWGELERFVSTDFKRCGPFVDSMFTKLDRSDATNKRKILHLTLLHFIVLFTQKVKNTKLYKFKPGVTMSDLAEELRMPPVILFGIFNQFGVKSPDSNNYLFSKQLFEKRTIFTLLLILVGAKDTSSGSKSKKISISDCRQLLSTIQVEAKDAGDLMRMAGCNLKRGANSVALSLSAPVQFPQLSRGRGK